MIEREITTAFTLLEGFSDEAITARRQDWRDKYVKKCHQEGQHLPSEEQLDRWYPGTEPSVIK